MGFKVMRSPQVLRCHGDLRFPGKVLPDGVHGSVDIRAGRLTVQFLVVGRAQVAEHGVQLNIPACHHIHLSKVPLTPSNSPGCAPGANDKGPFRCVWSSQCAGTLRSDAEHPRRAILEMSK